MSEIIRLQFGFFADQKWAILGTRGQTFIKRTSEREPFIRHYYLPQCPLVSPMFSMRFMDAGILFFDYATGDDTEVSDEEFASLYNNRDLEKIAPSDLPVREGIECYLRPFHRATA